MDKEAPGVRRVGDASQGYAGTAVKELDVKKFLEWALKGGLTGGDFGESEAVKKAKDKDRPPKFCGCGKQIYNATGWRYQKKSLCNRCGHKLIHSWLPGVGEQATVPYPFIVTRYCAECEILFRGIHKRKFGGRRIRYCSARCGDTFRKRKYRSRKKVIDS